MGMRVLGLDGGIASTGWAVVEFAGDVDTGTLIAAGSRTFESPEEATQSGPTLKNEDRRMYRGQRRVIHRRAQRMAAIRALFHQRGILAHANKDALAGHGISPWDLRSAGLDRLLTPHEWALALGHIAVHRGFRSNSKREKGANAADESSKMLAAIAKTQERITHYRTVGEMVAKDPHFVDRKRNRGGDFSHSLMRDDQESEVRKLFDAQKRLGNPHTHPDLLVEYCTLAFSQRPLASSEERVGPCPFEAGEKRTARFAPSFERFRTLSRLINLRLQTGREERALSPDEIALCMEGFGKTAKLSFTNLRKRLKLDANTRFAGISHEDEKHDVAARTGAAATGTAAFMNVLEKIGTLESKMLLSDAAKLDRAAEIITFNEDLTQISQSLRAIGLSEAAHTAIMDGVNDGAFKAFKGAAHISAKAARAIIPGLTQGLNYADACAAMGYDHSARQIVPVDKIGSPVARKALSEMLKQIKVLWHIYGPFDRIHVEMAREVGKSIEERSEIERGINKRTKEKEALRDELKKHFPQLERISGEDLLRYELWKEQNGHCLYSNQGIPLHAVLASDNSVQVDHILPWHRFQDDSFLNKTLCFTSENAKKRGRTPFEYFNTDKLADWDRFVASVTACKTLKGRKKRNYLLRSTEEVENTFRNRNINDTRYATRVLLAELKRLYFPDKPHLVAARPGKLTAKFRQAWGVESLKKDPATGKRLPDDRHHALDALIVALIDERMLQWATKASQKAEMMGQKFELRNFPEPWPDFRKQVEALNNTIFVSRAEVRRARGKAHDATIKQIREVEGKKVVFERKAVEKLTEKDLDLIPIPEPYGKIADPKKLRDAMVETLRAWIKAGKPSGEDQLPRSPAGHIIRKVRVRTSAKPAVLAARFEGSTADRTKMVRVDVFSKPNKKGKPQFFLVPIYAHEVVTLNEPPNRAVQQGADEELWPIIDETYSFHWSIYPMSLLEVVKPDGEVIKGYYRGLDRATGAIALSSIPNSQVISRGIGTRTLLHFKKLSVDRLGNVSEIKSEARTWRGEVCTSPSQGD
jgi:CRISPR-associated endonuclease Csn1